MFLPPACGLSGAIGSERAQSGDNPALSVAPGELGAFNPAAA